MALQKGHGFYYHCWQPPCIRLNYVPEKKQLPNSNRKPGSCAAEVLGLPRTFSELEFKGSYAGILTSCKMVQSAASREVKRWIRKSRKSRAKSLQRVRNTHNNLDDRCVPFMPACMACRKISAEGCRQLQFHLHAQALRKCADSVDANTVNMEMGFPPP